MLPMEAGEPVEVEFGQGVPDGCGYGGVIRWKDRADAGRERREVPLRGFTLYLA
jgi:hypothetical protein